MSNEEIGVRVELYPKGYLDSMEMLENIITIYDDGKGYIIVDGISLRFKYLHTQEYEVRFCAHPGTTSGVEYFIPRYKINPLYNHLLEGEGITPLSYYTFANRLSGKKMRDFFKLLQRQQRLDNLLT